MGKEKVDHPSHYNREDAMECIDEMILVFGKEAVKNFCLCNVWKYRYRAADKNGEEDLKKSDWYLKKYKELCGDISETTITTTYPAVDPSKWWTYPVYDTSLDKVIPTAKINCADKNN